MPRRTRSDENVKRRFGVWKWVACGIGIVVAATGGVAIYTYEALLPVHHFKHVPVLDVSNQNQSVIVSQDVQRSAKAPAKQVQHAAVAQHVNQHANDAFNLLLLGSDERPGQSAGHTDSMIVIHIDLQKHLYNILSIPRDTRVYLPSYGYTKLTSAQYLGEVAGGTAEGIDDIIGAITKLTGIPINYYAETDYWGLKDMVDALGGISMYLPYNLTLNHPWYPEDGGKSVSKGEHVFDGRMVAEVVHERFTVPGTDYGRQRIQAEALIGIARDLERPSELVHIPQLYAALSKFLIATNLTQSDVISLAMTMKGFKSDEVHYYQIPSTNETIYNDVLQADDEELVLDAKAMRTIVQQDFSS